MLGGLDQPSAGKLFVDGRNLFTMTEKELVEYKRDTVGFVWQNNARNLLPYMSALENVMTPMRFTSEKKRKERALELLELVGMSAKKNSRLSQLSGGEQQRIAIAIALANHPRLLLADEPTGSVDRQTADYIIEVFNRLNREWGQTILIVTHDVELAKRVPRVVAIRDGKISTERTAKVIPDASGFEPGSAKELEQEEFAILDRHGRVQLPEHLLREAHIEDRKVKMEVKDGKIVITSHEE